VDNVGFIGQNISHYQIKIGSQPLPDEITLYATSAEIFPGDTFTIGIIAAIPESEDITSFNMSQRRFITSIYPIPTFLQRGGIKPNFNLIKIFIIFGYNKYSSNDIYF